MKRFLAVFCFSLMGGSAHMEFAYPWQLLFQDPATPVMEGIIYLHHDSQASFINQRPFAHPGGSRCFFFTNNEPVCRFVTEASFKSDRERLADEGAG